MSVSFPTLAAPGTRTRCLGWFVLSAALLCIFAGCGAAGTATTNQVIVATPMETSAKPAIVELGIIPYGSRAEYRFLLSRFGVDEIADIESVETSCECTSAEIIRVMNGTSVAERALHINIADDRDVPSFQPESKRSMQPLRVSLMFHSAVDSPVEREIMFTFASVAP